MVMLSTTEARAHLTIIETLALVLADKMHHRTALHIMWKPLESFAPRCNCRAVLRFSPWLDGLRVAKCEGCEWKTLEASMQAPRKEAKTNG
jgi:hypothetical protein